MSETQDEETDCKSDLLEFESLLRLHNGEVAQLVEHLKNIVLTNTITAITWSI